MLTNCSAQRLPVRAYIVPINTVLINGDAATERTFDKLSNPHKTSDDAVPSRVAEYITRYTRRLTIEPTNTDNVSNVDDIIDLVKSDKCTIQVLVASVHEDPHRDRAKHILSKMSGKAFHGLHIGCGMIYENNVTGLHVLLIKALECSTAELHIFAPPRFDDRLNLLRSEADNAVKQLGPCTKTTRSLTELLVDSPVGPVLIGWLADAPTSELRRLLILKAFEWTEAELLSTAHACANRFGRLVCLAVDIAHTDCDPWFEEVPAKSGDGVVVPWEGVESGDVLDALVGDLEKTYINDRPAALFQIFESKTVEVLRVGVHPRQLASAAFWLFDGLTKRFPSLRVMQLVIGGDVVEVALRPFETRRDEMQVESDEREEEQGYDEEEEEMPVFGRVDLGLWKSHALPRLNQKGWEVTWQGIKPPGLEIEYLCWRQFASSAE